MQVLTGLYSNNSKIARFNTWTVQAQPKMINISKNDVEMNLRLFVLTIATKESQPTTGMLGIKKQQHNYAISLIKLEGSLWKNFSEQ